MTTIELSLLALSATLWMLGGYITNVALVATRRHPRFSLAVVLIWPAAVLYAMLG